MQIQKIPWEHKMQIPKVGAGDFFKAGFTADIGPSCYHLARLDVLFVLLYVVTYLAKQAKRLRRFGITYI